MGIQIFQNAPTHHLKLQVEITTYTGKLIYGLLSVIQEVDS